MKFQRVENLRIDHDITIKEISSKLGLNRDVYARYEKGVRQFPVDIIIKLAGYFDVSIDYLLGVSDVSEHFKGQREIRWEDSKKA